MKRNKATMDILKTMRACAREQVPMSQLVSRRIPMKRKAKLEKIHRQESRDL